MMHIQTCSQCHLNQKGNLSLEVLFGYSAKKSLYISFYFLHYPLMVDVCCHGLVSWLVGYLLRAWAVMRLIPVIHHLYNA